MVITQGGPMKIKTVGVLALIIMMLTGCQNNTNTVTICNVTTGANHYTVSLYASGDEMTKIINKTEYQYLDEGKTKDEVTELATNVEAQVSKVGSIMFSYDITDDLYTSTLTFDVKAMNDQQIAQFLVKETTDFEYISLEKTMTELNAQGYQCQVRQ